MYNREQAVAYAHKWAMGRNPRYLNFTGIGGDCTNFISQCIHHGGAPQNYKKTFGWYYNSAYDRAPAWTSVEYLHQFLTRTELSKGPYGVPVSLKEVQPGDVIQLSFKPGIFGHSLMVVETGSEPAAENILVATHSDNSDNRPFSTYDVHDYRCLRIESRG